MSMISLNPLDSIKSDRRVWWVDAKAPEVDRKINHNLCQLKIAQPISIKVESFEFEDQITEPRKRVLKRIQKGFTDQLNLNLESDYWWLEVRRTRFRRLLRVAINGFERTRMRSRILMLLPIKG